MPLALINFNSEEEKIFNEISDRVSKLVALYGNGFDSPCFDKSKYVVSGLNYERLKTMEMVMEGKLMQIMKERINHWLSIISEYQNDNIFNFGVSTSLLYENGTFSPYIRQVMCTFDVQCKIIMYILNKVYSAMSLHLPTVVIVQGSTSSELQNQIHDYSKYGYYLKNSHVFNDTDGENYGTHFVAFLERR